MQRKEYEECTHTEFVDERCAMTIQEQPTQRSSHEKEDAIRYLLTRGVARVEKEDDLRRLLLEGNKGQPLRVKLGVDPTHYDLTIGHAVVFRKLRQFQRLGHIPVVVIGDWTARLGDPSGRVEARKPLTKEQVEANAATYLDQFFRIVDRNQTEVRWQSEWFNNFNLADAIKLLGYKTVAQMLERDDFSNRYKSGIEINLAEFMYPLLQGYDSVALRADVEIGGTDQTFNLLVGRDLQPIFGQLAQQILTVNLIVGLDGVKKMGKSLDNYIPITAPANDMFGKLMSLPDNTMRSYFETLTDVQDEELDEFDRAMAAGTLNPRDVKLRLAREIVTEFHNAEAAQEAEAAFIRQFSERKLPTDIPEVTLHEAVNIVSFLKDVAKLVSSNNEARNLIKQDAVGIYLDGDNGAETRITDVETLVPAKDGVIVRAGKRKFARVRA
jgi:tyrosyl-tRNA synthetase